MSKHLRIANSRLLAHLLFWIIFILITGFVWGYCDDENIASNFREAYFNTLIELPILMLAVYINLNYLMPSFLALKKYIFYFLLGLLVCIMAAIIIRTIHLTAVSGNFSVAEVFSAPYFLGKILLLNVAPVMIITTQIKFWQLWNREAEMVNELTSERLRAELNYLQTQIHPHFLFNTLNNLYSLTLTKSDLAPKIVLKLSGLMRYMLQDGRGTTIPLQQEIEFLKNYIEIEKMRYGNRLEFSFNCHGIENVHSIAPLLLLPFIENAFKHGPGSDQEKCWITVDIKTLGDQLSIKIENSISANNIFHHQKHNGFGLPNVRKRLDLLYPRKHILNIQKDQIHYSFDLKLDLSKKE